mmetsp:Transcript_10295/g.18740  ORF Transcript_10295/g.18740 Transcript_10295/m.18740 type:complete len:275 (-) Transcript_10295:24-848(-)
MRMMFFVRSSGIASCICKLRVVVGRQTTEEQRKVTISGTKASASLPLIHRSFQYRLQQRMGPLLLSKFRLRDTSIDLLQRFLKPLLITNVMFRTRLQSIYLLGPKLTHHLPGRPHHQRTIRYILILRYQSMRADDAILSDHRIVQYRGPDADQRVIADGASVQHGSMADGNTVADRQWYTGIGMQYGSILHIRSLANRYGFGVVAANGGAEPNRRLLLHDHIADDCCIRGDPAGRCNFGHVRTQRVNPFHSFCCVFLSLYLESGRMMDREVEPS